jgi:hypothetical protein
MLANFFVPSPWGRRFKPASMIRGCYKTAGKWAIMQGRMAHRLSFRSCNAMVHYKRMVAAALTSPGALMTVPSDTSVVGWRENMATSKSVSRKFAAKKAAKTSKPRAAAKKAPKNSKRRGAGKKAAATRTRRVAAKKAALTRKTKATVNTVLERRKASEAPPAVAEIDNQIAIVRDNLRQLVEQAASSSGAANEELMSQRIAEQEAKLALLRKQREEVTS